MLLFLLVSLGLSPRSIIAAPTATFFSTEPVVHPLQPVVIQLAVGEYTGPAELVIYDSQQRPVGSWPLTIQTNPQSLEVIPRGALGQHQAVLFASGVPIASGPLYVLEAQTTVQTGVPALDQLYPQVYAFMQEATLSYWLNGHLVHGYRSPDSPLLWLRDHYYQGQAFRYFDANVTSLLDSFRRAQRADGSFPDFIDRPDWGIRAFRTPVEADVEYLFVLAVYDAWQMTGDDQWLIANLGAMQRALHYTLNDAQRWEPSLGLVKRPFTIDTWDFEYGPTTIDPNTGNPAPRHWIDEQTRWGIFHGDNTGLAQALQALARIETYLGQPDNAQYHRDLATVIMQRLNQLSWNGRFFTHHVQLIPWDVPGVDEASQLSLSNALALNRGVLSREQGQAILLEYQFRMKRPHNLSFAEWWSIDPPFPSGSFGLAGRLGENPGEYVNGGIMPLVGGELARGAFDHGHEAYGFDILKRYAAMIAHSGATYLWYYPTGGAGIGSADTIATDGWGSSAMLGALIEGAAGIKDNGVRYSDVTLSPRWPAAAEEITSAYVVARYAASDGYVAYRWQHLPTEQRSRSLLKLNATGSGDRLHIRLLLPTEVNRVVETVVNGERVDVAIEFVGESTYAVFEAATPILQVHMEVENRR
ncbi:MAG: hypothetical protein HC837_08275 [Chloroflexaceae bacterium]|nr:hypothetical protein [Chloroflexaceae bacterium]